MNRTVPIILIALLVLIGAYFLVNARDAGTEDSEDGASATVTATPSASSAGATASPTATSTQQGEVEVEIEDFAFRPSTITISKGMTVQWQNRDTTGHSVVSKSGPESFQSAIFGRGGTYSHTFTKVGTYTYECGPHPEMKGTVTVTE
jgi:plastocyanin